MAFANSFDVDAPSELPEEPPLHQDGAGGLRDLGGRNHGNHAYTREEPGQSGGLTWILPLTPVLSIRLATFTVVPQMSY